MPSERCKFLSLDGVCKAAPDAPKWAITLNNDISKDWTPGVPSLAKSLVDTLSGYRYSCNGIGNIETQKTCDRYEQNTSEDSGVHWFLRKIIQGE